MDRDGRQGWSRKAEEGWLRVFGEPGLNARIRRAWGADTSADPEGWSPANPSLGQCAVTALVVQDAHGGELLRGLVAGESHYWNRLPDGTEVDLTRGQFGAGVEPEGVQERTRDYVLSFDATRRRYELLRARVGP